MKQTWTLPLLFIALGVLVSVVQIRTNFLSRAMESFIFMEPEKAVFSGQVIKKTDATASGSEYIEF